MWPVVAEMAAGVPLMMPVAVFSARPSGSAGLMPKDAAAPPPWEGRLGAMAVPVV
jgi:hypothetical protein